MIFPILLLCSFGLKNQVISTQKRPSAGGQPLAALSLYFICLLFCKILKLSALTIFLPVFCSNSKRAFLATRPPFLAGILFSSIS